MSYGFEKYIGEFFTNGIEDSLEHLISELEKILDEVRQKYIDTIKNIKNEYEEKINILKENAKAETELINCINNKQIEEKFNNIKEQFKLFLENNTQYKKDNIVTR